MTQKQANARGVRPITTRSLRQTTAGGGDGLGADHSGAANDMRPGPIPSDILSARDVAPLTQRADQWPTNLNVSDATL